jgi:hypothetical protein
LLYIVHQNETEEVGSSRRYDQPHPSQTALLNVVEGKLSFGVPATQLHLSGFGKRSPGLSVRLFQAEL